MDTPFALTVPEPDIDDPAERLARTWWPARCLATTSDYTDE